MSLHQHAKKVYVTYMLLAYLCLILSFSSSCFVSLGFCCLGLFIQLELS